MIRVVVCTSPLWSDYGKVRDVLDLLSDVEPLCTFCSAEAALFLSGYDPVVWGSDVLRQEQPDLVAAFTDDEMPALALQAEGMGIPTLIVTTRTTMEEVWTKL